MLSRRYDIDTVKKIKEGEKEKMRQLRNENTGNPFKISCKCGRKDCDFDFTDANDIVITCLACGRTELIKRNE